MAGHIPNKKLGQHWLDDTKSLEAICNEAELSAADTVFEIGPGQGALTRHIAQRAGKVIALEFDAALAAEVRKQPLGSHVEVVQGDILDFNLTRLPKHYKVVANLPYYITSKIIRLLLESSNPPDAATLLVQKEVAERIAASPGAMSILAVAVQYYATVTLGTVVPAKLFTPPPQVDSQVVTLIRRPEPLFPDVTSQDYFRVVRAGFGEKRKKLRNSLSGGLHIEKAATEVLLRTASLKLNARAQELDLEAWHQLARAYADRQQKFL